MINFNAPGEDSRDLNIRHCFVSLNPFLSIGSLGRDVWPRPAFSWHQALVRLRRLVPGITKTIKTKWRQLGDC